MSLLNPRQMVIQPGSPSLLRPKKPPSCATSRRRSRAVSMGRLMLQQWCGPRSRSQGRATALGWIVSFTCRKTQSKLGDRGKSFLEERTFADWNDLDNAAKFEVVEMQSFQAFGGQKQRFPAWRELQRTNHADPRNPIGYFPRFRVLHNHFSLKTA